jgi:hypothetical protein
MADIEARLPIPNPEDWTDTAGAGDILRRARPTVYEMVDRGIITRYRIGHCAVFWVPELTRVAQAIERLAPRA